MVPRAAAGDFQVSFPPVFASRHLDVGKLGAGAGSGGQKLIHKSFGVCNLHPFVFGAATRLTIFRDDIVIVNCPAFLVFTHQSYTCVSIGTKAAFDMNHFFLNTEGHPLKRHEL